MSEEGNFLARIRDRIFPGKDTIKPPEQLSPEAKAQQAFYQAVAQSLTEEGLQSIADFEPPNSTFDLSKLGDSAVFRVKYIVDTIEMWDYCCVGQDVHNKDALNRLFVPVATALATQNGLYLDNIHDLKTLEKRSPNDVEVREVLYSESLLNWDNPTPTLPYEIFVLENQIKYLKDPKITLQKVEVVSGGKQVSEEASKTAEGSRNANFNRGLAPNPQMG